jgi:hypothetical protein
MKIVYPEEIMTARIKQLVGDLENIISLTDDPLYTPLEAGFCHSSLSPKEQVERLKDVCLQINACARLAIETR